jgi:hypothetical protein
MTAVTLCARHAEQVCIVLMVSACVHLLGVKRPGALQDYVTSVDAVSDKRPKADITGLFVVL